MQCESTTKYYGTPSQCSFNAVAELCGHHYCKIHYRMRLDKRCKALEAENRTLSEAFRAVSDEVKRLREIIDDICCSGCKQDIEEAMAGKDGGE